MRYFNVAGACRKDKHYMIDSAERLHGVRQLIDMEQYVVIHAPRQTGKTTYLKELVRQLNEEGKYYAYYCTLETVQTTLDEKEGIPAIIHNMIAQMEDVDLPHKEAFAGNADYSNYTTVLYLTLKRYCQLLDKPFVIFFDEADTLGEDTLVSFLRQLRTGYNNRDTADFVHSLALVGMRNIKDYRWKVRPDSESRHAASPFNIVTEVLTIGNFSIEQINELYRQHTDETGQVFEKEAVEYVFEQTQGQPWLVNAIAREVIMKLLESDYTKPVTKALAEQAVHNIIIRCDMHIDQLLEKLKETRVRNVVESLLLGNAVDTSSEDFEYTSNLGIVSKNNGSIGFSNPIYNEVITRKLNHNLQDVLTEDRQYEMSKYFAGGRIDMERLMSDFQQFWRENSGIWKEKFDYKEAAPHLIMMAFLQRVVNGGGDINREYAINSDRIDLCMKFKDVLYPIELKIRRDSKTLPKGLLQLSDYMDSLGCKEGWLVVFDPRKSTSWSRKIFQKKYPLANGNKITLIGA
ncbi:MAG: ATP-binding protein [Tannerella sp.]|nr:ATP-binding protein [Tannerella sp.]